MVHLFFAKGKHKTININFIGLREGVEVMEGMDGCINRQTQTRPGKVDSEM